MINNSTNNNINIPNISIQGAKGIGKDYFFNLFKKYIEENFSLDVKRYALGDILKELSYKENNLENKQNSFSYDYNYLKNDFNVCKTNKDLLNKINSTINNKIKNKFEIILKKEWQNLDENDKLFLIEIFKNVKELSTRRHLQLFSDYLKSINSDIFFFSNSLFEKINKDKENNIINNNTIIVNTDTRYLTELINFLLNDFFVIKLINRDIKDKFLNKEYKEHVSETELSLNNIDIGYVVDITGGGNFIEGKIRRMSDNEIINKIKDIINNISKFKGYSKEFKNNLENIKKELISDEKFLNLQQEYSRIYKLKMEDIEKQNINKNIDKELKNAYNKYIKYINNKYLKNIQKELNKEFKEIGINLNNNIIINDNKFYLNKNI